MGKRSIRSVKRTWEEKFYLDHHRATRHELYAIIEKYLFAWVCMRMLTIRRSQFEWFCNFVLCRKGYNGTACVLKTLCEVGMKRDDSDPGSFLAEIVRAIFRWVWWGEWLREYGEIYVLFPVCQRLKRNMWLIRDMHPMMKPIKTPQIACKSSFIAPTVYGVLDLNWLKWTHSNQKMAKTDRTRDAAITEKSQWKCNASKAIRVNYVQTLFHRISNKYSLIMNHEKYLFFFPQNVTNVILDSLSPCTVSCRHSTSYESATSPFRGYINVNWIISTLVAERCVFMSLTLGPSLLNDKTQWSKAFKAESSKKKIEKQNSFEPTIRGQKRWTAKIIRFS